MGKVIVYIAASLDGFIATMDNDVSWLFPYSSGAEDYGYAEFMNGVGTAVMGARTYEESLLHPERLLRQVKNYVISKRTLPVAPGLDLEVWHGDPAELVARVRGESDKDIYVVGGGQIVSRFLADKLVDDIRIFVVPVLLAEGIPLFTGLGKEIELKLTGAIPYPSGIVELRYVPRK